MQKSYLLALYRIAQKDHRVKLLLADSGSGYDGLLQKKYPKQVLDFGIAEENMVAAAAGMASCGKIPFVYTAGAFLAYRSMEFIRDDVCLQKRNVKLVGMGTGLAWSTLGATHHTTEDIGILSPLPNLMVLSPSTPRLAGRCVEYSYEHDGPVYIRIGMGGEKEFYDDADVDPTRIQVVREGSDVVIMSTGAILSEVLSAATCLSDHGISAEVVDVVSLSPFDANGFLREIRGKRVVFTVEEHSVISGLGSIVANVIAERQCRIPLCKIGLPRVFAEGYGTHEEVRAQNGLDSRGIVNQVLSFMEEDG